MDDLFESDPELLSLIERCAGWPRSPLAPLCAVMGVTVEFYWALTVRSFDGFLFPRVATGYANEADRRAERARRHRDGLHVEWRAA